ncbi:MAG: hypothetical protein ACO3QV_05365 [Candidatus Nanopelagicaceae bacterium]
MITESPQANRFIDKVDREAQRLSVQLLFSRQKDVMALDNREATDGYFSEPFEDQPGMLVIATGRGEEEWLHTLAHEYVHMWQWFNEDPVWMKWRHYQCESNYYRMEEATEEEACRVIERYDLPCGDFKRRSTLYLRRLKRDIKIK